jgi:hypothetical protein
MILVVDNHDINDQYFYSFDLLKSCFACFINHRRPFRSVTLLIYVDSRTKWLIYICICVNYGVEFTLRDLVNLRIKSSEPALSKDPLNT